MVGTDASAQAAVDELADRVLAISLLADTLKTRVATTCELVSRTRALIVQRRATRSWRYRMLLLAVGSTMPDGSDLSLSDLQILAGLDRYLTKMVRVVGVELADRALETIVEALQCEGASAPLVLH